MVSVEIAIAAIGAAIAVGGAGLSSGIGAGIAGAAGTGVIAEDPKKFGTAIVFQAIPQTQGFYGFLVGILILFGTGILTGNAADLSMTTSMACLGAGLAIGIAGFSAIGQGIASGAALGATAENEDMFARGMIFSVLPETQAIYGLLVAILLMYFTGIIGGVAMGEVNLAVGFAAIAAGLSVGLAGLSAIGQGIVAAGGVGATAKTSDAMGKSIIFAVMPETFAILGLLISILIMVKSGLLGV